MRTETVEIENISQCNRYFSERTLHPLVSVVRLPECGCQPLLRLGFYSIVLRETWNCAACCGQKDCDFSEEALLFFPPGRPICLKAEGQTAERNDRMLCFHPELIRRTQLESNLGEYTFFHYRQDEALHLSARERNIVRQCLKGIAEELDWGTDEYSKKLICSKIELFLDYCSRFYKRQFITRHEENTEVVAQTDRLLARYFLAAQARTQGLPILAHCARIQNLSAAYLNDLLRYETGKGFDEYAQFKRFDLACSQLIHTGKPIGNIAEDLGYSSVQTFARLFKQLKGCTPSAYRSERRN